MCFDGLTTEAQVTYEFKDADGTLSGGRVRTIHFTLSDDCSGAKRMSCPSGQTWSVKKEKCEVDEGSSGGSNWEDIVKVCKELDNVNENEPYDVNKKECNCKDGYVWDGSRCVENRS